MPLAVLDPGSAPTALALAGGQVVVTGPGLYVNRGIALGLGLEVTEADLDALEAVCRHAGVPAEVEISPWAHESLMNLIGERGYRPAWFRSPLFEPSTPLTASFRPTPA